MSVEHAQRAAAGRPLSVVLARLGGESSAKPCPNGYEAKCPAHEDRNASLSISESQDGKVLLTCHAGCRVHQICAALGLELKDLFPLRAANDKPPREGSEGKPGGRGPGGTGGGGRVVATYDYVDEEDKLLFQVVRFEPKTFRQRRPDPEGKPDRDGKRWTWKVAGLRQVPYRLPKVLAAAKAGETIWVCEGEKDVGTLEVWGLVGTCNAGGAGKWKREHAAALASAKRVVILPDLDPPGRKHAAEVAKSLAGSVSELKVLELPFGAAQGKDVSDWAALGSGRAELERLAAAAPSWAPPPAAPAPGEPDGPSGLPIIYLGDRQLRDVVAESWSAVHAANEPPRVFNRAGLMARIGQGEGGPYIKEMNVTAIYDHLSHVATWKQLKAKGEVENTYPDLPVCKVMEELPSAQLPKLNEIIASPAFDAEGGLIRTPGYHPKAFLWMHKPEGFEVPAVPESPSAEEVAAARALLVDDLFGDFPFVSDADRAHGMAALLLPAVRRMIAGFTPIHLVEAPSPGTGKGLLTDIVSIVHTGEECAVTLYTQDEDELRKRVTSTLIRARSIILIDNVNDELNSAVLAALVTTTIWEDRLLGFSQMLQLRPRATLLVTANNPTLSEELARRSIRVRLDRKSDRPWKAKDFRHANLREWARENRPRLVHAVLTLGRAWLSAGRPAGKASPLGSFETWTRVMGGLLEVAGVPGFLANVDELYDAADAKGREWREFIAAWWERHKSTMVKVGDLIKLVGQQALLPNIVKGRSNPARCSELGKALLATRGKRFGDLILSAEADTHNGGTTYQLVPVVSPATKPEPAQADLGLEVEVDRGDDPDAY